MANQKLSLSRHFYGNDMHTSSAFFPLMHHGLLRLICILYYTYIFIIDNTIERWSADGPFYNPLWRVSRVSLGVFWECFNRYGYKIPRKLFNHSIWAKLGGLTYEMYLLHIAPIKIC